MEIIATLTLLGLMAFGMGLIYLIYKTRKIMATLENFQAALTRIDAATTDIANDIRSLKDQIANQGLPADVEANILSQLEAKAAQLEAIGAETPEVEEPGEPEEPQA